MLSHRQNQCLTDPIVPAIIGGGIFSAFDLLQGQSVNMNTVGLYCGGLYVYNAMQCPMEAWQGRPSLLHNFASAGILGYVGVSRHMIGIPFIDPYRIPRQVPLPVAAFFVYGGMAAALAAYGGKRL
jgi:hypothetical protein